MIFDEINSPDVFKLALEHNKVDEKTVKLALITDKVTKETLSMCLNKGLLNFNVGEYCVKNNLKIASLEPTEALKETVNAAVTNGNVNSNIINYCISNRIEIAGISLIEYALDNKVKIAYFDELENIYQNLRDDKNKIKFLSDPMQIKLALDHNIPEDKIHALFRAINEMKVSDSKDSIKKDFYERIILSKNAESEFNRYYSMLEDQENFSVKFMNKLDYDVTLSSKLLNCDLLKDPVIRDIESICRPQMNSKNKEAAQKAAQKMVTEIEEVIKNSDFMPIDKIQNDVVYLYKIPLKNGGPFDTRMFSEDERQTTLQLIKNAYRKYKENPKKAIKAAYKCYQELAGEKKQKSTILPKISFNSLRKMLPNIKMTTITPIKINFSMKKNNSMVK